MNTISIAALALLFSAGAGHAPPGTTTLVAAFESLAELKAAVQAATKEGAITETQALDFNTRSLAIAKTAGDAPERAAALALGCGLRFKGVSPELDKLRGEMWDLVIAKDADEAEVVAPLVSSYLKDESRAAALAKKSKSPQIKAACAMVPLADLVARQSRESLTEKETKKLVDGLKAIQKDFATVIDPRRKKSWGDVCTDLLFQIEHLSIGALAPEIEAADTSGVSFKLSDYRGKVVLLDFWGNW